MSVGGKCPKCGKSYRAPDEYIGRHAKCSKCGMTFTVGGVVESKTAEEGWGSERTRENGSSGLQNAGHVRMESDSSAGNVDESTGGRVSLKFFVPTICIALAIGYFGGREHIKYELRSAFSEAGKAISESFEDAFGESNNEVTDTVQTNATNASEVKTIPPTALGVERRAKGFSLAVISARIGRPEVKDMFGDMQRAQNPALILSLRVRNTHDRKILRFREGNMFLAGYFRLRDDVDNVIRGIDYGAGANPVGAMSTSDDILPGGVATHVEVFAAPPAKTQFLILTVNLEAFGGSGSTEFKIEASQINGFRR